jgi:RimJ/RimL family protein N-acetyltransferase
MEITWTSLAPATVPPPASTVVRARALVQRQGLKNVLKGLPSRIIGRPVVRERALVLVKSIEAPVELPPRKDGLIIRAMEERDLERFRALDVLLPERRLADFAARLRSGRRAVIALADGCPIGYGWLSRQPEIDARCGIEISLSENEGYIYDGFIFPSHRHKRIYPHLLLWRVDYLQQQGSQRVYSIVFAENTPALRVHWQVGFRAHSQMRYSKIFNLRWRREYTISPPDGWSC